MKMKLFNNLTLSLFGEESDREKQSNNTGVVNYLSFEEIDLPSSISPDDLLEVLNFPVRLENALKREGIRTIGEFCAVTDKELMKIRNIGRKSVNYMLEVKRMVNEKYGTLQSRTPVEQKPEEKKEEISIPENQLISSLLERCGNDKAKEIIKKRYGLISGERQTLEEIGVFYNVTRERIRQIQVKALKRMSHPLTSVREPLIEFIEKTLFENGGILSAEEADIKIPEALGGITDDGSSVLDLLSDLGWIQSCKIGDIGIYAPLLNAVSLCKVSEKIIAIIKQTDLGIDASAIVKENPLFRNINDERFGAENFVLRYCSIDPRIEQVSLASGELIFRHYSAGNFAKKGWVALIKRVFEEEQMPLHFTEVADKVNGLIEPSGRHIDVRRIHSLMIEDKDFAHSGVNGTYGLTSWGFRKELTPQLIEECMKKAGFPLHWKQIYNYVSKYKNTKPGNIYACLETNRLFKKVDSGTYWLREES